MDTIINNSTLTLEVILNAAKILKTEFFGIDSQLDTFIRKITPFLLNPGNYSKNPYIVNLWGPTGTGKTAPVKRFFELIKEEYYHFDMGDFVSNGADFRNTMEEVMEHIGPKTIFVLDELQFLRTIDETGKEIKSPASRAVWELLDSGVISQNTFSVWDTEKAKDILARIKYILNKTQEINNNVIIKSSLISDLPVKVTTEKEESKKKLPNYVINLSAMCTLAKGFPKKFKELIPESEEFINLIKNSWFSSKDALDGRSIEQDFFEEVFCKIPAFSDPAAMLTWLGNLETGVTLQTNFSFKPVLIINIGNIDEAYPNVNHITTADSIEAIYKDSLVVTLNDVKNALHKRFRAEQVARLGHNHILWRNLDRNAFQKLFDRTVKEALDQDYVFHKQTIILNPELKEILFEELVSPSQGARCILTGVHGILTSLLPEIHYEFADEKEPIVLGIHFADNGEFLVVNGKPTKIIINLEVKRRYIPHATLEDCLATAVHEAGHAVVGAQVFQKPPMHVSLTMGNSISGQVNFDQVRSNVQDRHKEIMLSLAGIEAEKMIFGKNFTSLGGSSDFSKISKLALTLYTTSGIHSNIDIGNPNSTPIGNHNLLWLSGFLWTVIPSIKAKLLVRKLRGKTRKILKENKTFLLEFAQLLAAQKSLSKKELEKIFSNNFTFKAEFKSFNPLLDIKKK